MSKIKYSLVLLLLSLPGFINLNKFTALLMATAEPQSTYSWFALITLRDALERPAHQFLPTESRDAYISAAAEVLGVKMYAWDEEFQPGLLVDAPGSGGPFG